MSIEFEQFSDFIKTINNNFCLLITASDFETQNLEKIIKPHKDQDKLLKFRYKENNYIFGKIRDMYVLNVQCTIGSTGKDGSTLVTFEALTFNPRMALLIGIAFGNKEYSKIGDILISTNIYDYEKCTIKDDFDEVEKIKSLIKQPYVDCNEKLYNLLPNSTNDVYSTKKGTIISGEKICASETFLNKITAKIPTIWFGGEMEATGFASACIRKKYNNWLVIKAVSDFGDKKKRNNKEENQKVAITNLLNYLQFIFNDLKKFEDLENNENNQLEDNLINMIIGNERYNETILTFSDSLDTKIYTKLNLPNSMIIRSEMENLKEVVSAKQWINVYGTALSGKTIFVKQFIIKFGNYYYLSLSNNIHLTEFFYKLQREVEINQIKEGGIIVLDDFPKLSVQSCFFQSFVDFIEILEKKSIKIITIQNEKITDDVLEYFKRELFSNFKIEDIVENDVYTFLDLYGIEKDTVSKREIEMIFVICKKKIYLLNQLFHYFKTNNWNISSCILDTILQENKTISNNKLQLLLLDKITDIQSRELLYRLSQIIEPISYDTLIKIANIEPAIININEVLSKLINIWITETENNRYCINANIKKTAALNISEKMKITVNSILADEIIDKKTLNQLDICNAIIHCCLSDRYDDAANIYIIAIETLIKENAYSEDYLFTRIWKNMKLPKKISFNLQLDIRIRQIIYFKQQNISIKETIELSKDLFDNTKCPLLIKLWIPVLTYKTDFLVANKYIMEYIKDTRSIADDMSNSISFILKMCKVEQIILMIALGIKDIHDMISWLSNFKELLPDEINNVFAENKTQGSIQTKELFNITLEAFKSKITSKDEFVLLAKTYLSNYKDAKAKNYEFLQTIFLRQFLQIYIGKLNIEIINIINLEKEIDELPNDLSKGLILITITEEYKKIHSTKYKSWDEKLTAYILKNKLNISTDKL